MGQNERENITYQEEETRAESNRQTTVELNNLSPTRDGTDKIKYRSGLPLFKQ